MAETDRSTLDILEYKNQRILTTQQLAESYKAEPITIQQNFNNNKKRYEEGKHYYLLKGTELKKFLQLEIFESQNKSKIRSLYLWTERGALYHAKSLNTDKAWDVYDYLVDFYFRSKELPKPESKQVCEHKHFIKYYKNNPIIPERDFIELTGSGIRGINKQKHKLHLPEDYFLGGRDWNGLGWDLRQKFEKEYNVDYSEEETMCYLYRSGVIKAIEILNLNTEISDKLLVLVPQSRPTQQLTYQKPEKQLTQCVITINLQEKNIAI